MAMVSGQRSTLNPNAPLFIPTAYRKVEDFSPEWWELVKNSTWFRDFWLSQHPEGSFDGSSAVDEEGDDVVNLLPEDFDLRVDEEFADLDAQIEEFVMMAEPDEKIGSTIAAPKSEAKPINGLKMDVKSLFKDVGVSKTPKERNPISSLAPFKYQMKPPHCIGPKSAPRHIFQPR